MDFLLAADSGEYLYSLAAIFSFAAYVFSNIFWLRVFLVIAAVLYIITGLSLGLTSMTGWNIAYLIINFYHVILILFNKSTVLLPDNLKDIYKESFTPLSTREFKRIVKTNPFHVYQAGEVIITEGDTTNELFLLLSGKASVIASQNEIATISSGDFIGEMSFISNQTASADVIAKNELIVAYWTHADLHKIEQKNTDIYNRFLTIVGRDLVKKLQRKNIQTTD
ncbi:MAG: cyclic nucleotide-binding domain-containing protein [Cocleimonas sp.]